jgi:cytochrome P450
VASDGLPQHVLRAHVAELVETLLDQLGDRGAPADLHEALSFPLPVQVICELLGVPTATAPSSGSGRPARATWAIARPPPTRSSNWCPTCTS